MPLRRASRFAMLVVLGTALFYSMHTAAAASSDSGLRIIDPGGDRIEWSGLKPCNPPVFGAIQSVRLELRAKEPGTLLMQCAPIRDPRGRLLPSNRLGLVDSNESYTPFGFGNRWEPVGSYQAGIHAINLNLVPRIMAEDAAGLYETTVRFMFRSNGDTISCELKVSIEVLNWTSLSSLQPSVNLADQSGPEDDLCGYVEIVINSNSSWKLSVTCQDELLNSHLSVIAAKAISYRCEGSTVWHPLKKDPDWSVVASGTCSTSLRVHFRIADPRAYRSGFYSGAIKFKVDYF
jgi:hypothetical protein